MKLRPEFSPLAPIMAIYRHRQIILSLLRRDVAARYRGSVFDAAWIFLQPALFVAIFYFVFATVFQSRWTATGQASGAEFVLRAYAGLIVFNLFSEAVGRAPSLLLDHRSYVKKILFPVEILAPVTVGSSAYSAMLNMVFLMVLVLLQGGGTLKILILPLALLPVLFLTLGITWFLSALGVYFRDSRQIVALGVTGLMFLSPVFYPLAAVPAGYHALFMLNPLATAIEMTRSCLFDGAIDWRGWTVSLALSSVGLWLGYAWFILTRRGFSDVL